MKVDIKATAAILVLALAVLAGCANRVVIRPDNEGPETAIQAKTPPLNSVGFLSKGLNRRVSVQPTGAERTPTNTVKVYAVFQNRTDHDQHLQVRTQFVGAEGQPLEGPNAWQDVFLVPNGTSTYETYSTRTDVEFYYIEVIETR